MKELWDSSDEKVKEILSGEAIKNFFERQAHLLAAANVGRLFRNAIEAWKFNVNPEKSNDGQKQYAGYIHQCSVMAGLSLLN